MGSTADITQVFPSNGIRVTYFKDVGTTPNMMVTLGSGSPGKGY